MNTPLRRFEVRLSRRLLLWSLLSLLTGAALQWLASPGFWRGFGIQALAWGAVDAVIALTGLALGGSRRALRADPGRRSRRLKRMLWINTLLDVGYVTAGVVLAALLGRGNPAAAGHGWGVILQGAFLLFFDFFHAQSVPPPLPAPLRYFAGPEHQSFHWTNSPEGPGALLIHGFPGTPAEMQPVAELLHRQGWTVQAPLLPGFGPQIADIASYGRHDWLHAVKSALERMRSRHRPLLLLGYSMGGALAAASAVAGRPDGLILLSPFWRLGSAPLRLAGRLLAPFLPRYFRPLQKADFTDPRLLESLGEFLPGLDVSDGQVQGQLRELQVPVSIIREILACGRIAFARRRARRLRLPTLVLQGSRDATARPELTRRLVRRLAAEAAYREVDGGHDILLPQSPGWAAVAEEIGHFAEALRTR